jgi:hypothetical protein
VRLRRFLDNLQRGTVIPNTPVKALIFAPQGRDALVASAVLQEAGIASIICPDILDFEKRIDDNSGFAIVSVVSAFAWFLNQHGQICH